MATHPDLGSLDVREQLVRIDKHLADIDARYEETKKFRAEASKLDAETRFVPWHFAVGGVTAGAALVGATAAAVKIFF